MNNHYGVKDFSCEIDKPAQYLEKAQYNRQDITPNKNTNGSTLGEVIERLQVILDEHGPGLVVQVAGNDLDSIHPLIWSPEEQASNGGSLRDAVILE